MLEIPSNNFELIAGEGRNKISALEFVQLAENAKENLLTVLGDSMQENLGRLLNTDAVNIEDFYKLLTERGDNALTILRKVSYLPGVIGDSPQDLKFSELCEIAKNINNAIDLQLLLLEGDSIKNLKNSGLTINCIAELINNNHAISTIDIANKSNLVKELMKAGFTSDDIVQLSKGKYNIEEILDKKDGIIELLNLGFVPNDIVELNKEGRDYFFSVLDDPHILLKDKAFTQGAAMGAFEKTPLPRELAGLVADHLSKEDGKNLSKVNRAANKGAKEERDGAQEILDKELRKADNGSQIKSSLKKGSLRGRILVENSQGKSNQEKILAKRKRQPEGQGRV